MLIFILVSPRLSHPPKNSTFQEHRIAYLECGVNSDTFPEPTVTWYKGSVPVDFTGRNFFSPTTKSLLIREANPSDNGLYACEVSNAAGEIRHSATLTIMMSLPIIGTYVVH